MAEVIAGKLRLGLRFCRARASGVLAAMSAALLAGACAGAPDFGGTLLTSLTPDAPAESPASAPEGASLREATAYWGKAYAKSPKDRDAALNYARNLKAMGQKPQALAVLQQAAVFHATDRQINSEYGRLALEFDQLSVAKQLLAAADDPTNPDWRVVSAQGTVLAKEGNYGEAIGFFERALTLASDQPSVLNNLALAHMMNGDAEKAETILRRAAAAGGPNAARVEQNLALALGLQGKYQESTTIAAQALSSEEAAANASYLRKLVGLPPKAAPADGGWAVEFSSASGGHLPGGSETGMPAGGMETGMETNVVRTAARAPVEATALPFKPATF